MDINQRLGLLQNTPGRLPIREQMTAYQDMADRGDNSPLDTMSSV